MKRLLVLFVLGFFGLAASGQSLTDKLIIKEINRIRKENGLAPYVWDSAMTKAADHHARWVAATGLRSHNETVAVPGIKTLFSSQDRFAEYGAFGFGENLIAYYPVFEPAVTAVGTVELWMQSPPHKAMLLAPVKGGTPIIGVGSATHGDGRGQSWVLTFGIRP